MRHPNTSYTEIPYHEKLRFYGKEEGIRTEPSVPGKNSFDFKYKGELPVPDYIFYWGLLQDSRIRGAGLPLRNSTKKDLMKAKELSDRFEFG